MSLTDSEPNFRARAAALGLTDDVVEALCTNGVNTLAKYAFSSAYVPGNSDEAPFVSAMTTALGADPTLGQLASLRRLFHEAYSLTAAELKHSVERVEDMPVKKLAQPERADRLKRQQSKLKGIRIEGKLEPSDRLVDLAVSLYEENRLQHVELSRCTSKEQEVLNSSQREDKHVAIDASGAVRIRDKEHKMEADLSSDMFVRLALMRRGLAFDQANLLDYLEHDRWVEKMFDCRVASQPDGYSKISMQQIINADRKLFVKLAEGADLASRPQPQADHWMQFLGPPWSTLMFCTCCSRCQIALARQSRGLVMPVTTGLRLRSLDPRIRAKESQRVRAVDHLPSKCRLDLKAGHLETATTSPYVSTITFLMAANCP